MVNPRQRPEDASSQQEQYAHGYGATTENLVIRKAAVQAAFFLPHLRSGMSLLDCGCGPGSITMDLAEAVAPGQVVGIDIEPVQIERARASAKERGANVRFEVGNAYAVPFPDESFDAVFAHTLLQHLKEPMKALAEIRRVLKPGGFLGVREEDWGSALMEPSIPMWREAMQLYLRYWEHKGGNPYFPRHYRVLLRQAGFQRIQSSASAGLFDPPRFGNIAERHTLEPIFADKVIELGWADRSTVEKMSAAWREWSGHPDAFMAIINCEAVAWKEG